MSSIVSRSPPLTGSVSSAKERRWMSIRCGTSGGFSRREKLLRVTGAAFERAKVGDSSGGQRDEYKARVNGSQGHRRATREKKTLGPPSLGPRRRGVDSRLSRAVFDPSACEPTSARRWRRPPR